MMHKKGYWLTRQKWHPDYHLKVRRPLDFPLKRCKCNQAILGVYITDVSRSDSILVKKKIEFNRDTEEMGNVVQFAAQSVNLEVFFFTLHRSISLTCTHRNVYPPRHVTVRQGFNILS